MKYVCCVEKYPDVTYTVMVKRRSLFYLSNLIFPMTMIGMLTMLSFLLPAESGELVSFFLHDFSLFELSFYGIRVQPHGTVMSRYFM